MIRKSEGWRAESCVRGHGNVYAAERSASGVFGRTIGRHEGDIEISFARAGAGVAVDLNLGGDVSTIGGNEASCRGKSGRVNAFTGTVKISKAPIVGALHFDVESSHIVVADVPDGGIIGGIVPHAVVAGD